MWIDNKSERNLWSVNQQVNTYSIFKTFCIVSSSKKFLNAIYVVKFVNLISKMVDLENIHKYAILTIATFLLNHCQFTVVVHKCILHCVLSQLIAQFII